MPGMHINCIRLLKTAVMKKGSGANKAPLPFFVSAN